MTSRSIDGGQDILVKEDDLLCCSDGKRTLGFDCGSGLCWGIFEVGILSPGLIVTWKRLDEDGEDKDNKKFKTHN